MLVEIGHDRSIYTTEIGKCYKSAPFCLSVCWLVGWFEIQLLNIYQPLNDIQPFPLDCGGPEVTLNMDTLQLQLRLYYWISEKFYLNPPFLKVA